MAKRQKKIAEPSIGHNGGPLMADEKRKLEGYISEVERQEVLKKEIADDIGMIYASAKEAGFDVKAMRHIVKVRKADRAKQQALENAVDVYKHALGMLADLPLGIEALAAEGKRLADDMGLPPLRTTA